MKQVEHDNIVPFYGVSIAVSDFCLVFPWYENGNIMDHLKKKPDIDRFDLVSAFRQAPHSRCLPVSAPNSYLVRPGDYASCTRIDLFMAP